MTGQSRHPSRPERALVALLCLTLLLFLTLGVVQLRRQIHRPSVQQSPAVLSTRAAPPPKAPGAAVQVPGGVRRSLPAPVGFGRAVTGGENGSIYHVTSDEDQARHPQVGTLRYGLQQGGSNWIVFDHDMTILLQAPLLIPSDTTIDGRTHAVGISGNDHTAGLHVYNAQNVIIEGLTLSDFGDLAKTKQNDPDDAIDIQRSRGVWIDHCTLSRAADKAISVEDGGRDITISWDHIHDQEQALQVGALATAAEDKNSTVTMHHNWFDRVGYRTPLVEYAQVHVFNNYVSGWSISAVRSAAKAQVYLEGNYFRPGLSPRAALIEPAQACNDDHTICDGSSGNLESVSNVIRGRAFIRNSGPDTVFIPRRAYAYVAQSPGEQMVESIRSEAGARPTSS